MHLEGSAAALAVSVPAVEQDGAASSSTLLVCSSSRTVPVEAGADGDLLIDDQAGLRSHGSVPQLRIAG